MGHGGVAVHTRQAPHAHTHPPPRSTVYKGRRKKTIAYYAIKSVDKTQKARVLQEVRGVLPRLACCQGPALTLGLQGLEHASSAAPQPLIPTLTARAPPPAGPHHARTGPQEHPALLRMVGGPWDPCGATGNKPRPLIKRARMHGAPSPYPAPRGGAVCAKAVCPCMLSDTGKIQPPASAAMAMWSRDCHLPSPTHPPPLALPPPPPSRAGTRPPTTCGSSWSTAWAATSCRCCARTCGCQSPRCTTLGATW